MGGLVIDVFVAYWTKAAMDMWRKRGPVKWPIGDGEIDLVEESRWGSVHVVSIRFTMTSVASEAKGRMM